MSTGTTEGKPDTVLGTLCVPQSTSWWLSGQLKAVPVFEQRSRRTVCLMEWRREGIQAARPGGPRQCDLCCVFCNPFPDLPLPCWSPVGGKERGGEKGLCGGKRKSNEWKG